jgi:fumarate reductase subunit C
MKPYVRPMPVAWWLERGPYVFFMLRELTSVFVAAYLILFLVMIHRLRQGPAAYQSFLEALKSPLAIVFHVVALAFALFHTITWFNLTPKALVIRVGEKRLPPTAIIAPNYLAWIVISLIIGWIVVKG